MKLVIVESPAKSRTIEKYLGKDYIVLSSKGHIRDLLTKGKYGFGIDVENNFEPSYGVIKGKTKDLNQIKKELKNATHTYLATDPDREGENISWHLYDELGLTENNSSRIIFNEITKNSILESLKNPTKLDMDLVKSGETRRFLDRIIGFRLSNLLQRKISAKSAGRVQSVALKLIVDREREINEFIPEEYWTIESIFDDFSAELKKYKDKDIKLKNETETDKVLSELNEEFLISNIEEKTRNKAAPFPFKTSTLQQTASSRLRFSASKTMTIAQKLYEGIDIGSETVGLITYMRTDSTRLSSGFINETFQYVEKEFGKDYVGFVKKQKETSGIQDAHEGIRPTSIYRTPDEMKKYLSDDEYKLYNLIYKRALASLMANAKYNQTTINLNNNDYLFTATGSVLIFDGFLSVYKDFDDSKDKILPNLSEEANKKLICNEIIKEQHFTKPKPRFNEASLIKELEQEGIGRPSTYSTIVDTIKKRGYVTYEERRFAPTDQGFLVTDKLQEFFADIINVEYTREMESDLDKIALKERNNIEVLTEFYTKFEPIVNKAFDEMEKKEPEKTGESCPECDNPLVIRTGRYGEFVACSNYPECKYIKKEKKEEKVVTKCPKCDGSIIERTTKRGKIFWGCNKFPKCDYASWYLPSEEQCPKCKNLLVHKDDKLVCTNCEKENK